MQVGRAQELQQPYRIHEPEVQRELSDLGLNLICRPGDFSVPCFIPQVFEDEESSGYLRRFCDRILKQWPPRQSRERARSAHLVGQLGLLLSQKRIPEPQKLLDTLYMLDNRDEVYAMAFIKCLVCHGIGVEIPVEQWKTLGQGGLSERVKMWGQVVFIPEGQGTIPLDQSPAQGSLNGSSINHMKNYLECCHQLLKKEINECSAHEAIPTVMKYWANIPRLALLELYMTVARCDTFKYSWRTLLSLFYEDDSFWQVLRDRYPGQFDNLNSLMASRLPDGRCMFVSLWNARKKELVVPDSQFLAKLVYLGVDLTAETRPGENLLDELAREAFNKEGMCTLALSEELFKHLIKESETGDIAPTLFERLSQFMTDCERETFLVDLFKSKIARLRWGDLVDPFDLFSPSWLPVIPAHLKKASDVLSLRDVNGKSCFMDFWHQDAEAALDWLFDNFGAEVTPDRQNVFLIEVMEDILADETSSRHHLLADYLYGYSVDPLPISDACRRGLYGMILRVAQSKPGREHMMGGLMRLLRLLAAGDKRRLMKVDEISKTAWENIFGSNNPVPSHITGISLGEDYMFHETTQELLSYFPERATLYTMLGEVESETPVPVFSNAPWLNRLRIPWRLTKDFGRGHIPQGSVLYIDAHGRPGRVANCLADTCARRLHTLLKSQCKALPDRIVLDVCMAGMPQGKKGLSTAEIFARCWYRATRKPVSVIAYEGGVVGGVLYRKRRITHEATERYEFRPRHSRELLVTVLADGRMKKTLRPLKSETHFPRQLKFS